MIENKNCPGHTEEVAGVALCGPCGPVRGGAREGLVKKHEHHLFLATKLDQSKL